MQERKIKNQEDVINQYRREKYAKRGKVQAMLERFIESDEKVIELTIDPGEYKSLLSLQKCICRTTRKLGYDIRTFKKNDHLYILKGVYIDESNRSWL